MPTDKGGDRVEAAFEGIGVALAGTGKSIVDLSEVSYKAATSKKGMKAQGIFISILPRLWNLFVWACKLIDKLLTKILP